MERLFVFDVINQAHRAAIHGDASYGMLESVRRKKCRLIHNLVILHFQTGNGVDGIYHALPDGSNGVSEVLVW